MPSRLPDLDIRNSEILRLLIEYQNILFRFTYDGGDGRHKESCGVQSEWRSEDGSGSSEDQLFVLIFVFTRGFDRFSQRYFSLRRLHNPF